MLACLTIEENNRPTFVELASMPYFRRILGIEKPKIPLQMSPGIHGSALNLRLRSPSYAEGKMLRSEQPDIPRKISVDKPVTTYIPQLVHKQQSEQPPKAHTFVPTAHHPPKTLLDNQR